ncbi:MAG: threonylcarbamoyl-AMP synthase [Alphaproteobacteria bacterium]|nr:MAG: threonylcarbamoyl-AMP synthase [Alphaproteobacteria bacterium]
MPDPGRIAAANDQTIEQAADLLRRGRLVAFPTETVYGLGADATNDTAVAGIFDAKTRPRFNPLIIHLAEKETASEIGQLDPVSHSLIERFWPGALTIVVNRQPTCPVSRLASAGLSTIALRMPCHPVAVQLIQAVGRPLAAPSANRAGTLSPTNAAHVSHSLGDRVDLILDGGTCPQGIESTVVQVKGDTCYLLRPGTIAKSEIERLTGPVLTPAADQTAPTAPGQLASHYAPDHPLRLNAEAVDPDEVLLAFGDPVPGTPRATLNLSPGRHMTEAAANLFAHLHHLDKIPCRAIAVMAIPQDGLGEAINDRLFRAAAPRNTTD